MSKGGLFFKRGFQGVKEMVGASKKTEDSEVETLKAQLQTKTRQLKKIYSSFSKLPNSSRTPYLSYLQAMKDASEALEEGNIFSQCKDVFEEIDKKTTTYTEQVKTNVLAPLNSLMNICSVLDKRFKALNDKRLDMDSLHDKLESITKKPPQKQQGLEETEKAYNDAKDYYNMFREELVQDTNRCFEDIEKSLPQICSNCMKAYSQFVQDLNESWEKVPGLIDTVGEYDLNKQPPYTPEESSLMNEENVKARQGSDSFSAAPYTTETAAPSVPAKTTESAETVTALYDYTATDPGELSFKEGDVITIISKSGDWWQGSLNGTTGQFPSNYVK